MVGWRFGLTTSQVSETIRQGLRTLLCWVYTQSRPIHHKRGNELVIGSLIALHFVTPRWTKNELKYLFNPTNHCSIKEPEGTNVGAG